MSDIVKGEWEGKILYGRLYVYWENLFQITDVKVPYYIPEGPIHFSMLKKYYTFKEQEIDGKNPETKYYFHLEFKRIR